MTKDQRARLDANPAVKAARVLGFPEAALRFTNLALARAIQHWVHNHYPTWAPDDPRWEAWQATINAHSETITDAAAAYQEITA